MGSVHAGENNAIHPGHAKQPVQRRGERCLPTARQQQAVMLDINRVDLPLPGLVQPQRAPGQRGGVAVEQAQHRILPVDLHREQHRVWKPGGNAAANPGPALEKRCLRPRLKRPPSQAEGGEVLNGFEGVDRGDNAFLCGPSDNIIGIASNYPCCQGLAESLTKRSSWQCRSTAILGLALWAKGAVRVDI